MVEHTEAGDGQDCEHTTELDRSSLGFAGPGLPFAGAASMRASLPSIEDGALPFRSTSTLPPMPPLALPAPSPPPPAPLVRPATAQLTPPPLAAPALAAPRTELGDVFRRAFGLSSAPSAAKPSEVAKASEPVSAPISAPVSVPSSVPQSAPSSPPISMPSSAPISMPSSVSPALRPAAPETVGMAATLKTTSSFNVGSLRTASNSALPPELQAAAQEARLASENTLERRAIVDLLAFDPEVPGRLRRSKDNARLFAAPMRSQPGIDALATEISAEQRARNDVLRVLSCGAPLAIETLAQSFDALLDEPLELDMPLFLVEGEVTPTMDEVEALRAMVEHAKPLAGSNKRMLAALATAGEMLARPLPPAPEAALTLCSQIESASGELGLPARHLAKLVERTLREARSYKRRTLLGAPRLRATLTVGSTTVPIYLPNATADLLPLLPSFRMSALVETRPREDAAEASPTALVAFAVGRVLRARGVAREG